MISMYYVQKDMVKGGLSWKKFGITKEVGGNGVIRL